MPVTINGDGSISGLSVGGLGNGGIVDADSLASNAVTTAKLADGAATQIKRSFAVGEIIQTKFYQNKTQYSNNSNTTPTTIISGAITPTNSSNKILITYHAQVAYTNGQKHCHVQILKGGSVISDARGNAGSTDNIDANGNKIVYIADTNDNNRSGVSGSYSDTAGSTSAITYGVGININGSGSSYYAHANRSAHSTDYGSSTELILMEIKV